MNTQQPGFCPWCPSDGTNCGVCECEMREMARVRQTAGKWPLALPGREVYGRPDNSTALSATVVLACVGAAGVMLLAKLAGF